MIREYAHRVVSAVIDGAIEQLPMVKNLHMQLAASYAQVERIRTEAHVNRKVWESAFNPLEKPLDQARRELADALKREERRSENPSAFWRVADAEDALLETARKRGVGFERLLRDPLLYEARVFVRRQTTRGTYPTDDEIVDHLVRHCRFLRLIPEEGASSIAADAPIEQAKSILCVTAAPMCTCGHPHPSHYGPVLRCLADNGARQCPCDGYVPCDVIEATANG